MQLDEIIQNLNMCVCIFVCIFTLINLFDFFYKKVSTCLGVGALCRRVGWGPAQGDPCKEGSKGQVPVQRGGYCGVNFNTLCVMVR